MRACKHANAQAFKHAGCRLSDAQSTRVDHGRGGGAACVLGQGREACGPRSRGSRQSSVETSSSLLEVTWSGNCVQAGGQAWGQPGKSPQILENPPNVIDQCDWRQARWGRRRSLIPLRQVWRRLTGTKADSVCPTKYRAGQVGPQWAARAGWQGRSRAGRSPRRRRRRSGVPGIAGWRYWAGRRGGRWRGPRCGGSRCPGSSSGSPAAAHRHPG